MIENGMVVGDYYECCTYGECAECGRDLTEDDCDDEHGQLCDYCHQEHMQEVDEEEDAE